MEKKKRVIITAVLGIWPLVLCILYCAVYGKTMGDIYIPNSYWNDELLYFKQVEGILNGGVPGGYFGYNESRAQILSFAVWSPALMIHWVLWGLLFGWNLFSPVLCNLICLMLGMAVFGWLAKPGMKQAAVLLVLFSLFTPITRFIMSCMPETFCCSLILWYMGCLFAYEREQKNIFLWQMYGIAGCMILMRPYFVIFLAYPIFVMKKRIWIKLLMVLGGGFFVGAYAALERLLSADYLFDIMEIGFSRSFSEGGFSAGTAALLQHITDRAYELKRLLRYALEYGNFPGSMYAVFGLLGVLFLGIAAAEYKRRKENCFFRLTVAAAAAYTAMMAAVFFVYSLNDGGRHLMTFILAGITVLSMYSRKISDKAAQLLAAGIIGFFFLFKPGIPYDRLVPFREEQLAEDISDMSRTLQKNMVLAPGISWKNTVIWLSYDVVGEETVSTSWQQLYALPGGFGINFCPQDYVLEHIDTLKARYIALIPGGEVEKELLERGAVLLGENDSIAVYRLKI